MYVYNWYQWLLFFFIYCFAGWIIESSYVSVRSRCFVNRGFLRLPLLPLYGSGAIVMLWLTLPVQGNLFLVFLLGMAGASVLEYITGYGMERLFKMKYWDYSKNPFNLKGYICLGTSIAWGFLTILMTELVHRPVEHLVLSVPNGFALILSLLVSVFFVTDAIRSTREALDLGRVLESMTRMKAELEEIQLQMALLKAETSQKVSDFRDDTIQRAANLRGETAVRITTLKVESAKLKNDLKEGTAAALRESALAEQLKAITEAREKLSGHWAFYRKGILGRNPSSSSKKFGEALRELKEYSEKMRREK